MNWRREAFILRALNRLPYGDELHYQVQRRLVHSFPLNNDRFERELSYSRRHLAVCEPLGDSDTPLFALEFGAGRHLTVAMALAAKGVDVVAFDVQELARAELVANAAKRMELVQRSTTSGRPSAKELLASYSVDYRTMSDNLFAGVHDSSIDLVYSTSVLEHVPESDLRALFTECRRVLSRTGVASFIVDYKDHFAYSDPNLSPWNFLTIPESEWFDRFSPPNHYQNRLRHHEIVRLLEDCRFAVHSEYIIPPEERDLHWLQGAALDGRFRHVSPDALGIGEAHLVARPI